MKKSFKFKVDGRKYELTLSKDCKTKQDWLVNSLGTVMTKNKSYVIKQDKLTTKILIDFETVETGKSYLSTVDLIVKDLTVNKKQLKNISMFKDFILDAWMELKFRYKEG